MRVERVWARFAFRRRHQPELTAAEILWRDLGEWFREDNGGFHAGPSLVFTNLSQRGVERLWEHLLARAEPLDPTIEIWHEERDESVRLVDLPNAVALAHQGRLGILTVVLHALRSGGVRLPDLGVWVHPGSLEVWWWLGDDPDWDRDTVCGFVTLIGELRLLEPDSLLEIEDDPKPWEFLHPANRYLDAIKSRSTPPDPGALSDMPTGQL
jgi:hypothetical protein